MTAAAFHPGALWPDNHGVHINAHGGGMLYHEGVYYWYGEHKIAGTAGNAAHVGVHGYSSRDLYHWSDEGIALAVSEDPGSEIARGNVIERPKVLFNRGNGQFVMWFHLEFAGQRYQAARCAVAVANSPTGPFAFRESFRPNAGHWPVNVPEALRRPLTEEEAARLRGIALSGGPVPDYPDELIFRRDFAGGQMSRDMTLFLDDDGAAYHVHAAEDNGTLHISRLTDDFLRPSGLYARAAVGRFNEAPAIMKRHGRYFMFASDCTGWAPNPARLLTAEAMLGPWEELGNPCVGTEAQRNNTFESQSTFVLPVAGLPDAYIFMADRWRPENAIDGRYVWLPIQFRDEIPFLAWFEAWDLSVFGG